MQSLSRPLWAPVAVLLALGQIGVALAFIFGRGTSNILDAESTAAGISLSLGGAVALAAGILIRPHLRGFGNVLVVVGSALGAVWFSNIVMTPMAIAVIVGVLISEVRSPAPDS